MPRDNGEKKMIPSRCPPVPYILCGVLLLLITSFLPLTSNFGVLSISLALPPFVPHGNLILLLLALVRYLLVCQDHRSLGTDVVWSPGKEKPGFTGVGSQVLCVSNSAEPLGVVKRFGYNTKTSHSQSIP